MHSNCNTPTLAISSKCAVLRLQFARKTFEVELNKRCYDVIPGFC